MSTPLTPFLILLKKVTHSTIPGMLKTTVNPETQFVITSIAECASFFYVGTNCGLLSKNKRNGKIKFLTIENSGLPSNYITSILCTTHGKLYIGTNSGLVLWRILGFRIITSENHILHDTCITALAEDKDGKIWIGTRHSGLVKCSTSRPYSFRAQSMTYPNQHVNSITIDTMGIVWVGYTGDTFECFCNGLSYNYPSIQVIELARLKGTTSFLLASRNGGAFICDENAINNIALWPSYPNITCSYYNPDYSRMIICNNAGINIYNIRDPYTPPQTMRYSAFISAISCHSRDQKIIKLINKIDEEERKKSVWHT